MKYKNHTIKRTNCSTDVRREAFGRGYWAVADIYTIDGPVVMAGATERLTTIKECKEFITEALKEKEDETQTYVD